MTIRPAVAGDLAGAAALIARVNAVAASQCLHCAASSPADVRAALRRKADFAGGWERCFHLAVSSDDEPQAVLGCQVSADGALGWLWGPWLADDRHWRSAVPRSLLAGLDAQLPATVRTLEGFLHVENRAAIDFLRARGFSAGPVTHIYVARPGPAEAELEQPRDLGTAHEIAFGRLHAETFLARSTPAADLLAGRDAEHRIFAVSDGLRLLGYICVSINHAPPEGFIDYLAVRASAWGRGVGSSLLRAARHWAFVECDQPQLALCVSDWRAGARRLYEQAGFRLEASGVAVRRAR